MDAKVAYWTAAWLNLLAIVCLAIAGIRRAQQGDVAGHARRMQGAAALVALFVLSYPAKLLWLGREALGSWEPQFVALLRVHELCVALMLAAGGIALRQSRRLRLSALLQPRKLQLPLPEAGLTRALWLHRRAGGLAFWSALLALGTAAGVLYGMFQRS